MKLVFHGDPKKAAPYIKVAKKLYYSHGYANRQFDDVLILVRRDREKIYFLVGGKGFLTKPKIGSLDLNSIVWHGETILFPFIVGESLSGSVGHTNVVLKDKESTASFNIAGFSPEAKAYGNWHWGDFSWWGPWSHDFKGGHDFEPFYYQNGQPVYPDLPEGSKILGVSSAGFIYQKGHNTIFRGFNGAQFEVGVPIDYAYLADQTGLTFKAGDGTTLLLSGDLKNFSVETPERDTLIVLKNKDDSFSSNDKGIFHNRFKYTFSLVQKLEENGLSTTREETFDIKIKVPTNSRAVVSGPDTVNVGASYKVDNLYFACDIKWDFSLGEIDEHGTILTIDNCGTGVVSATILGGADDGLVITKEVRSADGYWQLSHTEEIAKTGFVNCWAVGTKIVGDEMYKDYYYEFNCYGMVGNPCDCTDAIEEDCLTNGYINVAALTDYDYIQSNADSGYTGCCSACGYLYRREVYNWVC